MIKNNHKVIIIIGLIILFLIIISSCSDNISLGKKDFHIIASTSTEAMDEELIQYAKSQNINLVIEHYGDLEIVDKLNSNSDNYDAVWISNSIWLYMLDNSNLTTDSKSIAINPVVMGITKSKAQELGFVDKDIYNRDILKSIKEGKLKYVMASVTKTNTGATTYLNFLNSLAGSPEVLTEEMIHNEQLSIDLKDFFKGVERVSGDENYLKEMFLNGDYNAMINYESSLIEINKELVSKGKEPLYLVYPIDGVAINDMPFAYINNGSNTDDKKEKFNILQKYLRSDRSIKKLESLGYRSWYGGVKEKTNKKVFNPKWGINTNKYLKDMKYPSKKVMTDAINLYIEKLRKPTHVVFCLDVSGSMYYSGLDQLKEAMNFILDYEKASKERLQFSKDDKISVVTFNDRVDQIFETKKGDDLESTIAKIDSLYAEGGTNIYDSSIESLKILKDDDSNEYTKTVILMTDGYSNTGSYETLRNYYKSRKLDIPIYSITFGESDESQLKEIAKLTNAKVFNGKSGLKDAFALVRSYN